MKFERTAESMYQDAVREVRKDPRSKYCFLSGGRIQGEGDPHHVIPRSARPEMIAVKRNIVIVNRGPHNIITSGKMDQIRKLSGIHRLLARMKELDKDYYTRFKSKLYGDNTSQINGIQ